MAQPGPPPRHSSRDPDFDDGRNGGASRPGRSGRAERPARSDRSDRSDRPGWRQVDAFGPESESDLPPWAGPAAYPAKPTGTLRRPAGTRRHAIDEDDQGLPDHYHGADGDPEEAAGPGTRGSRAGRRRGRAAATRLRKSRRRVYRWCGTAIAACIIAAGIIALVTHHSPKPSLYVTSLLRGEFKSVPSACGAVSTSVLNQYLPAAGRTSTDELSGSTNSQCSFTVDSKPNFLVLEVAAESYQPFAAATADGSATANAQDNYALVQRNLAHPPKKSPLPPAQISKLPSIGQQAFMAFAHEHVSGIVTDVITVVIRERNALITVSMSGQESGHGFGPVPLATLEAAAQAAAKDVLAKVLAQPTA